MRSFQEIIKDAGGPTKLAQRISAPLENAKAWKRNNSIPAPYWQAIEEAQVATLQELAAAAAAKRQAA